MHCTERIVPNGTIIKKVHFYEIQKEGSLSIGTSKDAHITDNLPFEVSIANLLENVKNKQETLYKSRRRNYCLKWFS